MNDTKQYEVKRTYLEPSSRIIVLTSFFSFCQSNPGPGQNEGTGEDDWNNL